MEVAPAESFTLDLPNAAMTGKEPTMDPNMLVIPRAFNSEAGEISYPCFTAYVFATAMDSMNPTNVTVTAVVMMVFKTFGSVGIYGNLNGGNEFGTGPTS